MKKAFTVGVLVLAVVAGCGPSWPFQWKASEATKQSQGLVEDNLKEARPHADTVGKVHIDEAAGAARAVTSYVGEPKVRRKPISVHNVEAINQALRDASRPLPTARDVVRAVPREMEESVMPWAELGIGALTIFAPGAAAVAMRYRNRYRQYAEAFRQTVDGVDAAADDMDADAREALLAELSKTQDPGTKKLVDAAQAEGRARLKAKTAKKASKAGKTPKRRATRSAQRRRTVA